jgi:hypothetical protein
MTTTEDAVLQRLETLIREDERKRVLIARRRLESAALLRLAKRLGFREEARRVTPARWLINTVTALTDAVERLRPYTDVEESEDNPTAVVMAALYELERAHGADNPHHED